MIITTRPVQSHSFSTSPPGRGRKKRAPVTVNPEYARTLLEQSVVTARDEQVLAYLDELSVLSADQLTRLFWNSPVTASHRLRRLYELHLLDRSEYNPQGMVDLKLKPSLVYTLGKAGRLWLDLRRNVKERHVIPPFNTVLHNLAVAEVMVQFTTALNGSEQWEMSWWGEAKSRVIQEKPDKKRVVVLEPDGVVAFKNKQSGRIGYYFIERDLGTENHAAFSRKIQRYTTYHSQEKMWQANWPLFPSVLLIANTAKRAKELLKTIGQAGIPVTWWISDTETLAAAGKGSLIGAEVWEVVKPGQPAVRRRLLPASPP